MRDRKMSKESARAIKKHVDRAMESIRQEPFVQKYMANEPKCLKCGKSVFKVERMSPEQVMLTCDDCGAPHRIDAQLDEDSARYL
jgi:lysyl-tRNA synthetase class I